ncbi:hypothetical protein AB0F17_08670 [Nonomuraea sp. NPDC026600]|uniref:hypothetical protein n=1 Tax=Nonomuraea sp. NPDC026600 TaxID=3155363 RepID=UPI0033DACE47
MIEAIDIRYGYTLADLDRLSRKAVHIDASGAFWRGSDAAGRYEIAWSAIAEHLCAAGEAPAEYDLTRAGTAALQRAVREIRHAHGIADNQRAFTVYWMEISGWSGSHEPRIVDAVALHQIWPQLRPRHRQVLIALATFGDHAPAAAALDMNVNLWSVHLSKARREFLQLWHQGEAPSGVWGLDRRSKTVGARRKNPAARVKYRTGRAPLVIQHGKANTYRNHACRCPPCHDAAMADQRDQRARKKAAMHEMAVPELPEREAS